MNILIVVDDFNGGAGNIAQLLALKLKEQGNNITMLLLNLHSAPRYDLNGINVVDVNWSKLHKNALIRTFKVLKKIKEIAIVNNMELAISFLDNNNTATCLALKKTKLPIVVSERSNPLVIFPKGIWKYLRRIAYKRADVVTVQFDCFKSFDNNRYLDKCFTTNNIIKQPTVIKENFNCDKYMFVSCSRFHPVKRFDLMLELFNEAYKQNNNIELHIYGDGKERQKLENYIKENSLNNAVFLHGHTNDVYNEIIKCDCYLMTSYQEGFPNALSEGLAVGLPAISFKCHDGIGQLVYNDINGYLIPEGDKQGFIDAILKISNSNVETLKEFSKKSIEIAYGFSENKVIKQWFDCMDIAVQKRKV